MCRIRTRRARRSGRKSRRHGFTLLLLLLYNLTSTKEATSNTKSIPYHDQRPGARERDREQGKMEKEIVRRIVRRGGTSVGRAKRGWDVSGS